MSSVVLLGFHLIDIDEEGCDMERLDDSEQAGCHQHLDPSGAELFQNRLLLSRINPRSHEARGNVISQDYAQTTLGKTLYSADDRFFPTISSIISTYW